MDSVFDSNNELLSPREDNYRTFKFLTPIISIFATIYVFRYIFITSKIIESINSKTYLILFLIIAISSVICSVLLLVYNKSESAFLDKILFLYTLIIFNSLIHLSILDSEHSNDFIAYALAVMGYAFVYRSTIFRFLFINIFSFIHFNVFYYLYYEHIANLTFFFPILTFLFFAFYISWNKAKTNKKLLDLTRLLEESNKSLKEISLRDSLTSLFNRHSLDEILTIQIDRHQRYSTPCSIMLIDIDHFKRVNDTLGHHIGDSVLIEFAQLLKQSFRATDLLFRYGGEEFIIILTETKKEPAIQLAQKLLDKIRNHQFLHVSWKITASIGMSELKKEMTMDECLQIADLNLYKVKNNGRDGICSDEK